MLYMIYFKVPIRTRPPLSSCHPTTKSSRLSNSKLLYPATCFTTTSSKIFVSCFKQQRNNAQDHATTTMANNNNIDYAQMAELSICVLIKEHNPRENTIKLGY